MENTYLLKEALSFIYLPWEWQNRSNCRIVLNLKVPLISQTSLFSTSWRDQATDCRRSLRDLGLNFTQSGILRDCELVPHLWRFIYKFSFKS